MFALSAHVFAKSDLALSFEQNDEVARMWLLIQRIYDNTLQLTDTNSHSEIDWVLNRFSESCDNRHPDFHLAQALQTEARQMRNNQGFSLRGALTSDDISNDPGDDPSAYLELSWDLWRQGLIENRQRARTLDYQAQLADLRAQYAQQKLDFHCRRYLVRQSFIGLLSQLLTLKLSLMEPVHKIEKRAYFKKWSLLDDLMVSQQDIRLLRQELEYLHTDTELDKNISRVINLPLIDINIHSVIQLIRDGKEFEEIKQLEKQVISAQNSEREDKQLRLFIRQQFDVGNNNDEGVVAGIRFDIPLQKKNRLALSERIAHTDQSANIKTWERIAQTRAAYHALQEQLQRGIKQEYRFRRAKERMRQVLADKRLNQEVQLIVAVTRLRAMLDAALELVRAKQELYQRVNEIFLLANIQFNSSLIKSEAVVATTNRARPGERSTYIWSKGFNRYRNEQILDFLEAKGIKRVLLTAGNAVKRDKMLQFVKLAKARGIKVESIVGPNSMFFRENHQQAAIIVEAAANISDAVHLDVEPHTFAEYKQNKADYLKQYLEMLREVRRLSPDTILTVSVPFHWPTEVYAELNTLVDRVYIMAYGSTEIKTITRRIQPALTSISSEKIVIVLRVSDFKDEWEIEKTITALQQATGIDRIGLHTFRRFIEQAGKQ